MDADDQPPTLEVWSDVACPWCYVGRRNLSVAMSDIEEWQRPRVVWRAFQLDPTIPVDGVDAGPYFAAKFGDDPGRLEQGREQLVAIGEELGIEFRFDRQRTVPNTHLAHRVLASAVRHVEAGSIHDALFAAYFEQGVDISSADYLLELVRGQLLDDELALTIMTDAVTDPQIVGAVDADIELAGQLGITGVPCFVADRRIAVPGAVPPPVLAKLLAELAPPSDEE